MDNICYHPWSELNVNAQGFVTPCCKYDIILSNDTVFTYEKAEWLATLKEQFLQGEKPAGCNRCWTDEAAGVESKRQLDWKMVYDYQVPALDKYSSLMFSFGNTCNLACRTCDSQSSSAWIKEEEKLKSTFPTIQICKHERFYQDQNFLDKIKLLSKDAKHIYFTGGETFLSGQPQHLSYLKYLIDQGDSSNVTLHYVTNATVMPSNEFWDMWSKFKTIDLQFSIDGVDQHFEYTRWPGKWTEVLTNIAKYKTRKLANMTFTASHVVSIFTVYYLPEFLKWSLYNGFKYPYLSLCTSPVHYDIKVLPTAVKAKVKERLQHLKLDNIVNHMYNEHIDVFDQSLAWIKALDLQRNQSFENTYPEFYQLLKDAECQI